MGKKPQMGTHIAQQHQQQQQMDQQALTPLSGEIKIERNSKKKTKLNLHSQILRRNSARSHLRESQVQSFK